MQEKDFTQRLQQLESDLAEADSDLRASAQLALRKLAERLKAPEQRPRRVVPLRDAEIDEAVENLFDNMPI